MSARRTPSILCLYLNDKPRDRVQELIWSGIRRYVSSRGREAVAWQDARQPSPPGRGASSPAMPTLVLVGTFDGRRSSRLAMPMLQPARSFQID